MFHEIIKNKISRASARFKDSFIFYVMTIKEDRIQKNKSKIHYGKWSSAFQGTKTDRINNFLFSFLSEIHTI